MKKFTSIAIAFLLALSVVPAMAADQTNSNAVDQTPATFQAFSNCLRRRVRPSRP